MDSDIIYQLDNHSSITVMGSLWIANRSVRSDGFERGGLNGRRKVVLGEARYIQEDARKTHSEPSSNSIYINTVNVHNPGVEL